jgi:hypothetical protein
MSEQSPKPEGGHIRRATRTLGAFARRLKDSYDEQQRQIAAENSISPQRLAELKVRVRRVTTANEYRDTDFQAEIETQRNALRETNPDIGTDSPRLQVAAYNRALIARLCDARCAIPYPGLTTENVGELRRWGLAIPFHLGAAESLFTLVELPDKWNMRPAHEEPSLEDSTLAFVVDGDGNPRLRVVYNARGDRDYGPDITLGHQAPLIGQTTIIRQEGLSTTET